MGYLDNEEKTRETIDEQGRLHSGDIGKFNDRRHLSITGRIKGKPHGGLGGWGWGKWEINGNTSADTNGALDGGGGGGVPILHVDFKKA